LIARVLWYILCPFWPSDKLFDLAALIAPSIMHAWKTGVAGDEEVFAGGVDHDTARG
jgi:hypothetical protein